MREYAGSAWRRFVSEVGVLGVGVVRGVWGGLEAGGHVLVAGV